MIFNVTTGSDPYGLVQYLLLEDPERVAWVSERNLMTTDPSDVIARLRAVIGLSSRIQYPIYHVSASWHPTDLPSHDQMEAVVDRVRETLGFDAHQVFVVAHNDTDHPHIHMVFNRVSPETGTALTMSHDYKKLDRLGRALEQEYGWAQVRSPFVDQGAGMDRPIALYTNGEVHARKAGSRSLVDARRNLLAPVFRSARNWGDLEARLAAHGFTLESTGRGLVVTDGDIRTRASRIAREFSYLNMAERFGETYDAWRVDQGRVVNPVDQVVASLTSREATFTERDLAREVYKVSRDSDEHWRVRQAVLADPRVVELGVDAEGRTRFGAVEQLAAEYRLSDHLAALAHAPGLIVRDEVAGQVAASLDTDEQRLGLHSLVMGRGRIAALGGLAGTGKSVVLGRAKEIWSTSGYMVVGGAAYGKQADDLGQALGVSSRTLASWEASWAVGRDLLTERHVMAIDEAGLMDTRQAERLLARVRQAGAKIVLVGDPPQLNPVGAGMPFRQILRDLGAPILLDVRRQRDDWQKTATILFSEGSAGLALERYDRHGMLHWHGDRAAARVAAAAAWFEHRLAEPQEVGLMIAYSNADVRALNKATRSWMRQAGMLGDDRIVVSSYGVMPLAAGDEIMFRRNDRRQHWVKIDGGRTNGVANGTMGRVVAVGDDELAVRLRDGREAAFRPDDYKAFHHAYAVTAHKAQGVTVDRSFVVISAGYDRSLGYVSFSRHRHAMDAFVDGEAFQDRDRLGAALSKVSVATNALDFIERSAARHLLPQSVLETAVPVQPLGTRRRVVANIPRLPEAVRAIDGISSRVRLPGLSWQSSLHALRELAYEPPSYGRPVSLRLAAPSSGRTEAEAFVVGARGPGHTGSRGLWASFDNHRRDDLGRSDHDGVDVSR